MWDTPWCLSLSCASISTIYFQAFGMMSAINFWFVSMMCWYHNSFACVNKSASCFGALTFSKCLEMHLQNGSVSSIWSSTSCLLSVRGSGVTSWMDLLWWGMVWWFPCQVKYWEVLCLLLFGVVVMFCFLCWMLVHQKWWLWASL